MRHRLTIPLLALTSTTLLASSCGDDGTSATSSDTDSTATESATGAICNPGDELPCICPDGKAGTQVCLAGGGELSACECGTADSDTGTTDPTAADSGTTDPTTGGPTCGNGVLDEDEECDDGNINNGDQCLTDCTLPASPVWTLEIDGQASGPDGGSAILVDADGNLFALGYERTTDEGDNLWLRRMDGDGNEVWTLSWDGGVGANDYGSDLAWHPSGDLLVVGSATVDEAKHVDILAMRVSPADGSVVWSITHDGDGPDNDDNDSGRGIAADADGNVYVTGQIRTADQLGDVWLAKYDPDGAEIWTMPYSGPDGRSDAGNDVVVDLDGNVVVVGAIGVQGKGYDAWIRKYDPDGVELWTDTHGLLAADQSISAVAIDSQGAILAAGFEGDEGGGGSSWLRKYDPDGTEIWTRTSMAHGHADVVVGPDDAVYTAGSIGVINQGANVWLRKYDSEGVELWAVSHNGTDSGSDFGSGIVLVEGGFVVIGEQYVLGQDYDIWIRRYAEG